MDLNRREAQRNAIKRVSDFVASDSFPEASIVELNERVRLLQAAYERFMDEHLRVVEEVEASEMSVQHTHANEAAAMYERSLIRMKERINQLNCMEREARNQEARELEAQAREARLQEAQEHEAQSREARARADQAQQVAMEQLADPPRAMAPSDVRLERIKPMRFSGDYSQWHEWKSLYESLVHRNETLSEIQRFHYLKQSIDGAAANVISGWHTTGENYAAAYEALVSVFDNKYRIVMAYLDELTAVPQQTSESHAGLRQLIDTINRVTRQLKVIGCPVQHWDDFLVHILLTRMASTSLEEWENSHDSSEMPTMEQVVKFLERRARGKLNAACGSNVAVQQVQLSTARPATAQNKPTKSGAPKPMKCHHCSQQHPMFRCPQFLRLSVEDRRNKVKELKLCFNCFSPGHRANTSACRFGPCQRCNKNQHHNSILCSETSSANVNVVTAEPMEGESDQEEAKQNF